MFATAVSLLFSGLVQAAISPPRNLVLLHPVAWVPALAVFSRLRGRRALIAGWTVGASANLAIFCWLPGTIHRFGGLPLPVAAAVWILFAVATGAYAAVFAWGFAPIRRVTGDAWPLAAAAWFSALEFLNPQIFGYLQGDAWYQVPHLFLVSAATGVSGVSFLVLLCNGVVLQGIECARRRDPGQRRARRAWARNAAVLVLLVAMSCAYSSRRLTEIRQAERTAEPVRIALVQPNHTIERRTELERLRPSAAAEDLVALSRQAMAGVRDGRPIDVFVWPEGALRADPAQSRHRAVLDFARATGAEIWTGAIHYGRNAAGRVVSHNSAFRIDREGRIDRRYDKNILVPFGEYVPLRDVVPGFDRIPAVADFEAGRDVPIYDTGRARFVFLICYEAIRSAFVRQALDDDVDLLVNVTVDAWYGHSSEQSQHLMLAAVQSALNGLPLVRATTTGISAVTDASGVLTAQAGNFTREVLVRDVRPVRVAGPYSRWGDWFAWACVLASALLLAALQKSARTK